jgi:formate dehydrogenase iron-sulfur subunit
MNFAGAAQPAGPSPAGWVLPALLAAALLKLSGEAAFVIGRRTAGGESLARSARLMRGRLAGLTAWRFACGLSAMFLAGTQALSRAPSAAVELSLAALLLFVAGELLERLLFFKAVAPAGMPGGYS